MKFYFSAESLERAFDRVIFSKACSSGLRLADGEACAENILTLIEEKKQLSLLWSYLDGVISGLTEKDGETLKRYAGLRCGTRRLGGEERNEIKRAVTKLRRRLKRTEAFSAGIALTGKYYCLLT